MARLGAGVDDFAAVPLFAERVNRGLDPPDHPFHVNVVDLVDNLRRDGLDRRGRRNPGVVNDHVEATQRGAGFLYRRKYLLAVRDVHLHGDGVTAVTDDFIGHGSGRLRVIVGNGDGKPILHQAKRNRFTNPLA
ncbi:Uncharacterised protein [Klebsiella pneumoniae]|nr:Uncharacterised protein [Klebsiella pneumoniae]